MNEQQPEFNDDARTKGPFSERPMMSQPEKDKEQALLLLRTLISKENIDERADLKRVNLFFLDDRDVDRYRRVQEILKMPLSDDALQLVLELVSELRNEVNGKSAEISDMQKKADVQEMILQSTIDACVTKIYFSQYLINELNVAHMKLMDVLRDK